MYFCCTPYETYCSHIFDYKMNSEQHLCCFYNWESYLKTDKPENKINRCLISSKWN